MKLFILKRKTATDDCHQTTVCRAFEKQFASRFKEKHVKSNVGHQRKSVAGVLISDLETDSLETELRKFSKGYGVRRANQASRKGFHVREFEWNSHLQDIHEINTSMPERNGKPMSPSYLRLPQELKSGGKAEGNTCNLHWIKNFGVFRSDGKLVAYIKLKRQRDILIYTTILGHGSFLRDGVMYLLHHEILRGLSSQEQLRQCLLVYSSFDSGGDGLKQWKRRGLFEEFVIQEK